jgi:hypothetical protein
MHERREYRDQDSDEDGGTDEDPGEDGDLLRVGLHGDSDDVEGRGGPVHGRLRESSRDQTVWRIQTFGST